MKKTLIALALALVPLAAQADGCTTTSIFKPDGTMVYCTTCCYNGQCTATCF